MPVVVSNLPLQSGVCAFSLRAPMALNSLNFVICHANGQLVAVSPDGKKVKSSPAEITGLRRTVVVYSSVAGVMLFSVFVLLSEMKLSSLSQAN